MKGHSIIISRYESIALSNLESRSCSKCTCVTVSNEVSTCTLSVACRVEQGRLEGVRERGLEFKKNEKVVKREKTEISVVNGTQFSLKKVIINFGGWKSEIKIFQGMWKIYRKKGLTGTCLGSLRPWGWSPNKEVGNASMRWERRYEKCKAKSCWNFFVLRFVSKLLHAHCTKIQWNFYNKLKLA